MSIVVSGVRPTGNLHLGNYYGAITNFLKMQERNECYFFIADLHSLTTHPDPKMLHTNVRNILSEYLACGIDPEKAAIYMQSDIPEIVQLYLLLNMLAPIAELKKTVSFKDKIRKNPENINAGLFTYPVLMAADILIFNANYVPVGKDQEQHLELTRNYASRFNHRYNVNYFNQPTAYIFDKELIEIPGLNGSGKMGKSESNCIYLVDNPQIIEKKVRSALTDNGPVGENTPKPDYIENLFTLLRAVSTPEVVSYYENLWIVGATKWYSNLKKQLAEDIIKLTIPIRQRVNDIRNDDTYLRKVTQEGAEKAKETARKTLKEVKQLMGFKSF
ncbi:tryptophan--tRNA ligase [Candidatus Azobacteroides pseudotrichonymphae]|uniref:Tryptophan--tRNA ligase n=1 Tax=Azobacteroides pseudotrichonymphae genomovar. CFP2 TaxID=511995 RepID=B6YQM5_AZOPC|nr:tryptophan--tRNA ligase [Candidatus Azobacteroides pseudotrichonymphae]BAG83497.1 tryptophanyl-tRNA synthetase [Candidatus Azobacteroides pseudotrichonymphae genomovar. CFP2]